MIIATAGHIDHGKTTLLSALTGMETTHLPEEQQRGLTIDLGYAYLPVTGERHLSFIDVPGHERFLSNMLAGVCAVRHALLVVACDDGMMAQTYEHLTILSLLPLHSLTVVLTKADKVASERLAEVREQVQQELARFGWPDPQLFVTAGKDTSTQELNRLRAYLAALPQEEVSPYSLFRLSIDRVFTIKGVGIIVTGTALGGEVRQGKMLWLSSVQETVRVRGLRSQNQLVEQGQQGERIALNLAGSLHHHQISRGDTLSQSVPPTPSQHILVELRTTGPVRPWQPVYLYHAASKVSGRLALLKEAPHTRADNLYLAEVMLDKPLYLAAEDRLIVRDISNNRLLGGIRILLLAAPKRGRRQEIFLAWLAEFAQAESVRQRLLLRLQREALPLASLEWEYQLAHEGIEALLVDSEVEVIAQHLLLPCKVKEYCHQVMQAIHSEHQLRPDQQGIGMARLRRMALPTLATELATALLERMLCQGDLQLTQGWLHAPTHRLSLTSQQEQLWRQIENNFSDEALWVRELAQQQQIEEKEMRHLLSQVARLGYIVAVVPDRYYRRERIVHFARVVRNLQRERGSVSAVNFRNELSIGRKLAIQILEYFDRVGLTWRRGNQRVLRDNDLFGE